MRIGLHLLRAVAAGVAIVGVYVAAGFGFGSLPTSDPVPVGDVSVAIISNSYHTDLVLPAEGWREILGLPPEAVWVAFGWGDRGFYLDTPHLGDLRPGVALEALTGMDASVLHVRWYPDPITGENVVPITVTAEQAGILAAYIRAAMVMGKDGKPVRIPGAYDTNDAFYAGNGHWTPIKTCNEWLARALRQAHIRTAVWAPFPGGITQHLAEPQ